MASFNDGINARLSDGSPLRLHKGADENIQQLPLEDGRLSFATDSKRIYLDCDFTDGKGQTYNDRLAFGGNSGIFYGVREFTTTEIENRDFQFIFPDEFNSATAVTLDVPSIDDLILNTDGCFYRVTRIVEGENKTYTIVVDKLTVAGSGGGGEGGTTGLTVARDPNQVYNIVARNQNIPVGFKVIDSLVGTTIDVEITINGYYAGTERNVPQGIYTNINLYKYINFFSINDNNIVNLRFSNEYGHAAQLTLRNIRILDLKVQIDQPDLGLVNTDEKSLIVKPYGGSILRGGRSINFRIHIPGTVNTLVVSEKLTADNGDPHEYKINLSDHIEGQYTIDVWISGYAEEGDTELLVSEEAHARLLWRSPDSTTYGLTAGANAYEFNQYDTVLIHYLVAYAQGTTNVHLQAYKDNESQPLLEQYTTVINNQTAEWPIVLTQPGVYRVIVSIQNDNLDVTVDNIVVHEIQQDVPVIEEDNSLQLYLEASNRSNNETQPAVWEYKNIQCEFENFNWSTNGWLNDPVEGTSLTLANGASLKVPFSIFALKNADGEGAHNVGKTIEFNFRIRNVRDVNGIIINAASWTNDNVYTGIVCTGNKICMNTPSKRNYMTVEEEAALSEAQKAATNGLRAYLDTDTRVHVAFSIQPIQDWRSDDGAYLNRFGLIYTYVDGTLSGIVKYNESLQDVSLEPEGQSMIYINSEYADIDIYSIRVYSRYCQSATLLNNYAAELPTIDERLAKKVNNDVLLNGEISLKKVQEAGNIPYIVFTDLRETGDKKGNLLDNEGNTVGYGPKTGTTPALPTGKKTFKWAPCYFVDPQHPDRNIGDQNHLVEAVIYGQGTSSMAYAVKNLRVRFRNKADKYSLLPAVPGIEEDPLEMAKWSKLPKVALFTLKADFMDSSLAHNTGTGNALAALQESVHLKTPAQEHWPDKTICTNVVGRPIIAFWRMDDIGSEVFIGRYNFDTDKAEHELFGFTPEEDGTFGRLVDSNEQYVMGFQATTDESKSWDKEELSEKIYYTAPSFEALWTGNGYNDAGATMKKALKAGPLYEYVSGPRTIQCWEFLNNGSPLCGFRDAWDENWDKVADNHTTYNDIHEVVHQGTPYEEWTGAFESRYPEYETEAASDKRAFARLVNWLASTDQTKATGNPFPSNVTYEYNGHVYAEDTKEYRLAKFVAELPNYMVKSFVAFYYVLTEALLMVDSRAKNMMMCSFDIDNVNNTGHWFPIFYDMDTILGVDNSGMLRFAYDVEDDTDIDAFNGGGNYGRYDANQIWQPNDHYSVLWANFREGFRDDIVDTYNNLRRGKLNVNFLLNSYNTLQANAFAEIYNNEDAKYKYIRPLTTTITIEEDGEVKDITGADRLYVSQGTRSLHRKYFLNKRLSLLDGKYAKSPSRAIDFRFNDWTRIEGTIEPNPDGVNRHPNPKYAQFTLTSTSTQYGLSRIGDNGPLDRVKLLPNIPTDTLARPRYNLNNTECDLYLLGDIYDIGDLSDKFPAGIAFHEYNKLRYLRLGNTDPYYRISPEYTLNIENLEKCPLLEHINVAQITLLDPTFDFNAIQLKYLKEFYAGGSNVTSVSFADGGNLHHVELPASITTLKIKNNIFYDTKTQPSNLTIEGYSNLNNISISQCPEVDTQSLMTIKMNQDTLYAESYGTEAQKCQLLHIRLPDVNWTFTEVSSDNYYLDTINDVTVIRDVKLLDYINTCPGTYTPTGEERYRLPVNNEHFGGTITINNDEAYVDELALKNKYSQAYPNLKFVFTNAEHKIAAYDIIIHNDSDDRPVPANEATQKQNSITLDSVQAENYNLKEYLENDVDIPTKTSSQQWTYEFKGWSYTRVNPAENVDAYLDIIMSYDETNDLWTAENATTQLTLADFTDNELHLYPVFKMNVRYYEVTFLANEQGDILAKTLQAWDAPIQRPANIPGIIDYDPDGDGDVSKTTLRQFVTYRCNGQSDSEMQVHGNLTFTPEFSTTAQYYPLHEPIDTYFDTMPVQNNVPGLIDVDNKGMQFIDPDTIGPNTPGTALSLTDGVIAVIKEEVSIGAICVPKKLNNKWVVGIVNRSPHLRRLYFEEGCPIRFILAPQQGNAGFNGSSDFYTGFVSNGPNEVLEYVDLAALKQLSIIGGFMGSAVSSTYDGSETNSRIFANCPNLVISGLPDSLMFIGSYAFSDCYKVNFDKLPKKLIAIGARAFAKDTGITEVQFNNAHWTADTDISSLCQTHNSSTSVSSIQLWPYIGESAFTNCTNLHFYTIITTGGQSTRYEYTDFSGVQSIGSNAFAKCSSLVWHDEQGVAGQTLRGIGVQAFMDCDNLRINKLSAKLQYLGDQAFMDCGTIPLDTIPRSLNWIGKEIFNGTTIDNGDLSSLAWEITYNTRSVDGETESDITVNPTCFSGLILNNANALLKLKLPRQHSNSEGQDDAETWRDTIIPQMKPWSIAINGDDQGVKAFGAKKLNKNGVAPNVEVTFS